MLSKYILIIPLVFLVTYAGAQNVTSDDLFKQARQSAFGDKDYPKAIRFAKEALQQNPDYTEVEIFLGRVYTWSEKTDTARIVFKDVLSKHPESEDGALAYGSLEYWNNNYVQAIGIVNSGLTYHPKSPYLLLLKAKVLNAMRKFKDASLTADTLLTLDPANTEGRALASRIRDNIAFNKIGVSYDFVKFDKEFNDPWHLASVEYTRQTSRGSITARLNYANRFSTNATQVEVDAYPHISQVFYAYVSGGYSGGSGVFPRYRGGFSLYANLPSSFEAEGGFRFLTFGSPTWVYTGSLGKYYKNWWFNLRAFLTPANSSVSQSYTLRARYYFGGADDYFTAGIGTGVSPDDPRNNILLNQGNIYQLKSNNFTIGYRHAFKTLHVIYLNASLDNQEYQEHVRGNQFDLGVGYLFRF